MEIRHTGLILPQDRLKFKEFLAGSGELAVREKLDGFMVKRKGFLPPLV